MRKKLTSEQWAEGWKAGAISLRAAVGQHWKLVGLPVNDNVLMVLELILGFANLDMMDMRVPMDDKEVTVRQIIEEFKLEIFLG